MADEEEQILILAPVGRDAELAQRTLASEGIAASVCATIEAVPHALVQNAGGLLLTQEALSPQAIEYLLAVLSSQPPWSDLPIVILVSTGTAASVRLAELLGERVNATFLERPVGAATLVQAVQMALRARRRQYELRDHLRALAEAEEAERQARTLAEEAIRIRDDFLASVTHDLKNPLSAIRGFSQLLQRQITRINIPESARLVEHLGRIESTANRTISQIDELLDLARLQAGQHLSLALAAVDVLPLLHRVAHDWQEMSPLHRVRVEAAPAELFAVWDPQRLERAISNLLGNAIKYSPEGGEVTVRLERRADSVVLTIQDEGIGIPRDDLPHVFQRFYRARNTAGLSGTGLGLSGVRQIVEEHGGTITLDSVEGEGTRVTVHLPLGQRRGEGQAEAAS